MKSPNDIDQDVFEVAISELNDSQTVPLIDTDKTIFEKMVEFVDKIEVLDDDIAEKLPDSVVNMYNEIIADEITNGNSNKSLEEEEEEIEEEEEVEEEEVDEVNQKNKDSKNSASKSKTTKSQKMTTKKSEPVMVKSYSGVDKKFVPGSRPDTLFKLMKEGKTLGDCLSDPKLMEKYLNHKSWVVNNFNYLNQFLKKGEK